MLIDTHAHLFWQGLKEDIDAVIERAREKGVEKIVVPAVDYETGIEAVEMAEKYSGFIYAAVGLHPGSARRKKNWKDEVEKIKSLVKDNRERVVAVGEIGIDLKNQEMRDFKDEQKKVFKEMVEIAEAESLPVIIHTRDSLTETLDLLDSTKTMPQGVFHCFSFDETGLKEVLKRGFYVSFCGNMTWSKRVSRLVSVVPEEKLLLETDSPFMSPRNEKGEKVGYKLRNEPANVRILARVQADLRGVSLDDLVNKTGKNAKEVFEF